MVVMSSTLRGRVVKFQPNALPPRAVEVLSVSGEERISQPYRFEIDLVSKDPALDATAILQAPAFLGIKQGIPMSGDKRGIRTLKVHGVLSDFEERDRTLDWVVYHAVLVPRLWRLSLNVQSRIFMDKAIPEIVEEVLKTFGFSGEEYELRLGGREYPKREYVVQYQESDLNFVQRLCEHEGIAYFFEQGEETEKVVFGDSPASFEPLPGFAQIKYHSTRVGEEKAAAAEWYEEETVLSFGMRQRVIQKEVTLQDYNYRTPAKSLVSSSPVVDEGVGRFYQYANHYKDEKEGKAYAAVRAEEIKCRQKVFRGQGQVRSFHPGGIFQLEAHFREDFNQGYLLTEVRHRVRQTIELTAQMGATKASYENEFAAIPATAVFRPERTTPRPRVTGVMHGKIDAAGDGKYAEIDDEGRYKVVIPFDLSGRDKGKATRWIRMAQPYSGPNFGMHFPLHKGAEVILVHLDGDPDRPIIAAAVPNPETGTTVKGENQTQCVIRTGGGNQIIIEDTEGSEKLTLSSPHSGTSFTIGAP